MIEILAATEEDKKFMREPNQSGGSEIIDPVGRIIAGPLSGNEEGILYADVDLEDAIRARVVHDFGGHYIIAAPMIAALTMPTPIRKTARVVSPSPSA